MSKNSSTNGSVCAKPIIDTLGPKAKSQPSTNESSNNQLLLPLISPDPISRTLINRYRFGFDNILVGQLEFLNRGYYISNTLSLPKINKIYLKAKENMYIGVQENEDELVNTDPLPPVEYWVVVREIDAANNIVWLGYLPIASVGETRVREKVVIESNNSGTLNFTVSPDIADGSNDFILYRDGVEILRPLDYTLTTLGDLIRSSSVTVPDGFNYKNEYIADYELYQTQEDIVPVPFTDSTGLIRYNSDNSISLTRPDTSQAIRTEINLIIIMRGSLNTSYTSVVDEITFAAG